MHHFITLACLVAAVAAYIVGWGQGITAFVLIGIALEGLFWVRLLPRKQRRPANP